MPTFPALSFACPIPWDEMRGDERERFCSKCSRHVVNISLLTEEQRAALLAQAKPGELCVSYYRRLSGEFVSAENPLKKSESRRVVQFGVAALSVGAVALAVGYVPRESVEEAERAALAAVDNVSAQAAMRTREAIDKISERFGAKKKKPPVMLLMGAMVCAPPPPAAAPSTPATPSP